MSTYRQTNHNGRVNAKTGKVYSRNHNDRKFDVSKSENIDESLATKNIILHYDIHNIAKKTSPNSQDRISIDEHEHQIYTELFGQSLSAQNTRNIKARHPERNKTIHQLLEEKNTCPEETVFQVGSLEDGYPDPKILMAIFNEFQEKTISLYGDNIHFLDAVLHVDEAVPHLHVRKVWTHNGKDGLDISQNKALKEMGFERPDLTKSPNKWNNAKISFSEWERNLKIELCKKHGIDIEVIPKHPGKATMEKEEAIALKLQEHNQEYRAETERLTEERNKIIEKKDIELGKIVTKLEKVSADLITEEMKNKKISDTNIFGQPRLIQVTPQEYRSWQRSAETKEHNEYILNSIKETEECLNRREQIISKRESVIEKKEKLLQEKEENINRSIFSIVKNIIREKFQEFFDNIFTPILENFNAKHQNKVQSIIKDITIDPQTAIKLTQIGYSDMTGKTISDVIDIAERKDILDVLTKAKISPNQVEAERLQNMVIALRRGQNIEACVEQLSHSLTKQYTQDISLTK